jgi:hypothetical protein
MVKYDLSLRQAAAELGHEITIEEAESLKDRKLFKAAIESATLAHYARSNTPPLVLYFSTHSTYLCVSKPNDIASNGRRMNTRH